MKLKCCMVIGVVVCVIMGSMLGCSSKEDGRDQLNPKEQTISIHQTEETGNENENIQKGEEQQPAIVTADYAEVFQSIRGCAVTLDSQKTNILFTMKTNAEKEYHLIPRSK